MGAPVVAKRCDESCMFMRHCIACASTRGEAKKNERDQWSLKRRQAATSE